MPAFDRQELEMQMNLSKSFAVCAAAMASAFGHDAVLAESKLQPSLIIDLRAASYSQDPEEYRLPGFQLGGEGGLSDEGLSLGHTEFSMSGIFAEKIEGKFTAVIHHHMNEVEADMEELWLQTVGLGNGLTFKGGRFFSDIGYLNNKHPHMWDFADEPLVYRGMLGGQYNDDGLQASWIAPTETYWRIGVEAFKGAQYPFTSIGNHDLDTYTVFTKIGGDFDESQSWQLGLSYIEGDSLLRQSGHEHEDEHDHGDEDHEGEEHEPAFSGDSEIIALDFVYKWAPGGNPRNRSFVFQMEYFQQRENGRVDMLHEDAIEESTPFKGRQSGAYLQGVYKFHPNWKTGLRYDMLFSDNSGDADILEEAGLASDHDPYRASAMVAWLPNEYTTLRLQYNYDKSSPVTDHQFMVQFVYGFGPHSAHQF